jgi:S-(hydroxymethyl)glutathione dehydrogenase/alcohol dehydrogenase
MAGAEKIIAIDLRDDKLAKANEFGATHTINATGDDLIQAVRDITEGRGADYTFEAAGIDHTLQPSLDVTRPGGDVILLGKTLGSKELPIRWSSLAPERMITRSSYGGAHPKEDLPFLARAYLRGELMLDELIDTRIRLDDINKGFSDMEEGWLVRSVVEFAH